LPSPYSQFLRPWPSSGSMLWRSPWTVASLKTSSSIPHLSLSQGSCWRWRLITTLPFATQWETPLFLQTPWLEKWSNSLSEELWYNFPHNISSEKTDFCRNNILPHWCEHIGSNFLGMIFE
jgi:hypothetical protein